MISAALIERSLNPTEPLILCALGFCAGIGLFFYGFRLLQRRRLILDTPFSKIRSASMGMVEISGLAVGPYTMVAPISARPCYYYRTLVWEWKQEGKNKQWVKIAGECMHVPFFVDDNTGRVLVDPRGAELDLHRDFQEEFNGSFFSSNDVAPGNVNSFLARHGIVTSNRIRVEEFCIKPKNSLFVLGTLAENPGLQVSPQPVPDQEAIEFSATRGALSISIRSEINITQFKGDSAANALLERFAALSRSAQPAVVMLSSNSAPTGAADMTQQQKIAAAMLKAGISNPAAWNAAGVTPSGPTPASGISAGVQVIADPSVPGLGGNGSIASNTDPQASGFDSHPPVVLMKGTNNKTFLISWRSQREVASSLGWKCALMIWGGPALALICLYFFLGIKNLF